MDSAEIVERGTILRATVGSTVHGLHHGGQDDRDEMAVYVEPPEYLVGLARARDIKSGLYGFEHYVERFENFTRKLEETCHQFHYDHVTLSTDKPFDEALSRYLMRRGR